MYNLDEIKNSEGLELIAYKRKGDVWTIGYGSTYYEDNTRIKKRRYNNERTCRNITDI